MSVEKESENVKENRGKWFGKKVENFLNHIKMRLGDVFYNSFWSIDNFNNFLWEIEQRDMFINSGDNKRVFTLTYRKNGKYWFVLPEKVKWKVSLVKKEAEYDKIYSKWWYFIVEKNGKKWLCNRWWMEIIEPKYDNIYYEWWYFIVEKNGKKWLCSGWWMEIIEPKYDEIKVIDNYIFLKLEDSRKMMNKGSKELSNLPCVEVLQDKRLKLLWYHVAIIKSGNGKIWLLSTKDGEIKVYPLYDKYRIDFLWGRIVFEDTSTWDSCCYEESANESM